MSKQAEKIFSNSQFGMGVYMKLVRIMDIQQ
jgi:hypothetical protein